MDRLGHKPVRFTWAARIYKRLETPLPSQCTVQCDGLITCKPVLLAHALQPGSFSHRLQLSLSNIKNGLREEA